MRSDTSPLHQLLCDLKQDNSLKAWSLIITFFGDSIAPRGGAVSASSIQSIMAQCGIGSGTVRTALSRLGKDGWVERNRAGRYSFYRLTEKGAMQSSEASDTIYAAPAQNQHNEQPLYLIVTKPGQTQPSHSEFSSLSPHGNVFLLPVTHPAAEAFANEHNILATVSSAALPDWVATLMLPASLSIKYHQLHRRAGTIVPHKINDSAQALALRTLLIHEWRRVRLRPGQPDQSFCPTIQHQTHQRIAEHYLALSRLADQWLTQEATGPAGRLPAADIEITHRFR